MSTVESKHKPKVKKITGDLVGLYYQERRDVRQKLRMLAAAQEHNSLGAMIRKITLEYVEKHTTEI